MSWLSNSLQLAGELLESVDQKASGKLKQRGGTRHTTHLLLDLKLRNDLSAVERQLANSTEQLAVCQDELEALDKECTDKITSLERQLEQRVTSLLAELTEASAAHVQLKKEYADSKQSMYARQCALEATNAELTSQVATLQHASAEPTASVRRPS
ncbi:hypothetical protein DYB25_007972 [Aphanomyces astaci]|uniref:Uncharacterized protein n=1 Tax=Aphanomyces astaci TaxID=112090 RepID=A0A397BEB8_APHAT|nr:hypothetical protein DYB25_007972 [Aphanomyces astaci]